VVHRVRVSLVHMLGILSPPEFLVFPECNLLRMEKVVHRVLDSLLFPEMGNNSLNFRNLVLILSDPALVWENPITINRRVRLWPGGMF